MEELFLSFKIGFFNNTYLFSTISTIFEYPFFFSLLDNGRTRTQTLNLLPTGLAASISDSGALRDRFVRVGVVEWSLSLVVKLFLFLLLVELIFAL